ncbi:zf-HC2 domain-containing protein [Kitasatospora azatica]|uniref:zf-HC2 domain-containing protein n=1 Tax=Kitasatospora azatica TaxID=58347 RepID=UPI00068D35E2|nr:zf-HC2 domain-containing protein [Kitasatospora azatica]
MTSSRVPPDPQEQSDRHLDAGAYVLGLLDEPDRTAFEEHLAGCSRCRREVDQLGGLEPLLAEYAASGAEPVEPSPRLLDALLDEVAATRRRGRVRRRWLVAVAAALVLGGPAVTAAVMEASPAPAPPAAVAVVSHGATGPTGANATIGVAPKAWGSAITLTLGGVTGPRSCDLVAVSTTGAQQTVTSWTVPDAGYTVRGNTVPQLTTAGGVGFQPGEISHFEVRDLATGQILVSVPVT